MGLSGMAWQEMLCFCSLGLQAWVCLVWLLCVCNHGEPHICESGSGFSFSVKLFDPGKDLLEPGDRADSLPLRPVIKAHVVQNASCQMGPHPSPP